MNKINSLRVKPTIEMVLLQPYGVHLVTVYVVVLALMDSN